MRLIQPSLQHLLYLAERVPLEEMAQWEALTGRPWDAGEAACRYYRSNGIKFALVHDGGLPEAAGGLDLVVGATWESWMMVADGAWREHGEAITRETRGIMDRVLADGGGGRRLQTRALANRVHARRWYERQLGMKLEALHPCYGADGEDVVTYARLKE